MTANSYVNETIVRQQMEQNARIARHAGSRTVRSEARPRHTRRGRWRFSKQPGVA